MTSSGSDLGRANITLLCVSLGLAMTISSMNEPTRERNYETIEGFFIQDAPPQKHPIQQHFGLIDGSPQRWLNLRKRLQDLNAHAKHGESFKLVFFCRHGQSYHNVGKGKYATQEWKSHWGRTNGDDEITWGPDSDLTPIGVAQALHIKKEWEKERPFGIPLPDKIYTSPLTRALRTCDIAFDWLTNGQTQTPILVVENCREGNGVYTYDKRRSRSWIEAQFPKLQVEDSFTEEDELWVPDVREPKEAMAARAKSVLDMIFDEEPPVTYACCTLHGGLINSFLSVLGCPKTSLPTGAVYPVIIRGSYTT